MNGEGSNGWNNRNGRIRGIICYLLTSTINYIYIAYRAGWFYIASVFFKTTAMKKTIFIFLLSAGASKGQITFGAYPNPSSHSTRIDYKLPTHTNEGEIIFYDLGGNEIKRFKVNNSADHLSLSTADIPAGTYLYHLQASGTSSDGKKLIVIK